MRSAIVLTLFLGACAAKPVVFDKPGLTQAGFERDKRECIYEGEKARAAADWRIHDRQEVYETVTLACMKARGYTARRQL
jgi:hypothetical protein